MQSNKRRADDQPSHEATTVDVPLPVASFQGKPDQVESLASVASILELGKGDARIRLISRPLRRYEVWTMLLAVDYLSYDTQQRNRLPRVSAAPASTPVVVAKPEPASNKRPAPIPSSTPAVPAKAAAAAAATAPAQAPPKKPKPTEVISIDQQMLIVDIRRRVAQSIAKSICDREHRTSTIASSIFHSTAPRALSDARRMIADQLSTAKGISAAAVSTLKTKSATGSGNEGLHISAPIDLLYHKVIIKSMT